MSCKFKILFVILMYVGAVPYMINLKFSPKPNVTQIKFLKLTNGKSRDEKIII